MPTRRLMTKGLYNARDLGGFPTRDGKTTKFGVFVRSEAPCELPESDIAYLLDYGVTASIDLRSTGEAQSRPNELQGHMTFYHKPLFNEAAQGKGPGGPPRGGPGAPGGHGGPPQFPAWGETYKQMAEESREWAKEVLTIAAENEGAILYHCTTGKDRTGVLTCYLLSIAGVAREDIAADYCVSMVFLEPVYEKMRSGRMKMGPPPEGDGKDAAPPQMGADFFQTPASAMLTLIDYLDETYGGVVAYLRFIGVPEEVMEKIRSKFLEDA